MDSNSDNVNQSKPIEDITHFNETTNVGLLRRTFTNTSNVLKRTFTVSSNSVKLFSNAFEYDDSVVVKDDTIVPSNGCQLSRRATKQELDNINKDLEYIVN